MVEHKILPDTPNIFFFFGVDRQAFPIVHNTAFILDVRNMLHIDKHTRLNQQKAVITRKRVADCGKGHACAVGIACAVHDLKIIRACGFRFDIQYLAVRQAVIPTL